MATAQPLPNPQQQGHQPARRTRRIVIAVFLIALGGSLITAIIVASRPPESAPTPLTADPASQAERYYAAFLARDWNSALSIADTELQTQPGAADWLTYHGMALSMIGRHEEATEAFLLAEVSNPAFSDKQALYLRARSLHLEKMYALAQQVLDRLHADYPASRFAERGQELAVTIERKLGEGITPGNVNWYLARGVRADASQRPAIAVITLEEYLLLNARLVPPRPPHPRALLSLGSAWLELGDPARALERLMAVDASEFDYYSGLFRGLAMIQLNRLDDARAVLEEVVARTGSESIRERATGLLERQEPPGGN